MGSYSSRAWQWYLFTSRNFQREHEMCFNRCLSLNAFMLIGRHQEQQLFFRSPPKKKNPNKYTFVFLQRSLFLGDGRHGCALLTQWNRRDGEYVWYDAGLGTGAASVPSVHWLITLLLVKAILSGGDVMAWQRRPSGWKRHPVTGNWLWGGSKVIGHEGS